MIKMESIDGAPHRFRDARGVGIFDFYRIARAVGVPQQIDLRAGVGSPIEELGILFFKTIDDLLDAKSLERSTQLVMRQKLLCGA